MADEKKHIRKHIVHKHTTKGFNERHEIEDILREKLEVGEIALNVGKDRPSLVFFAEHTPVSPHDADTNFDKMIELRPSPYVIHSASTDNVKPEIKEDHSLFDPYFIENFLTKLSDDYVEPVSAVTLGPGTTLDEAIGQLVLSDKQLNGRIDNMNVDFATIDGVSVKSNTAFKSRMLNGHTALEDRESEYSGSDGCAEMWIGKIDNTPILTSNELGGTPEVNNFKFAKINGSAITFVNQDPVDITIPMTQVSAGHGISIVTSGIDNEISFAGLSVSSGSGQFVKDIKVNENDNTKLDVTFGNGLCTKEEFDEFSGNVVSALTEIEGDIVELSGNVVSSLTEINNTIEENEYVTAMALNDLNDRIKRHTMDRREIGTGNAVTSISASTDENGTHIITYRKDLTFSEVGHTHESSNVVDSVAAYDGPDSANKLLRAEAISGSVVAETVLTQNTFVIPAEANSRKLKSAAPVASATTTAPGTDADAHVAVIGDNVVFGIDIPRGDKGERGYSVTGLTAPTTPLSGSSEVNTYTAMTENGAAGTFSVWNGAEGKAAEEISGLTLYNQAEVNTGSSEVNQYKLFGTDGSDFGMITVFNGAKGEKGDNGKAVTIKPDMQSCTVINEHGFVYTGTTQPGGFEQYHLYILTGTGATSQTEFDDFSDVGLFAINGVGIDTITATNNSGSSEMNVVTVTLTDGRTQQYNIYNGAQGQQGIQGIQGPQGYSITGITAPVDPTSASGESNIYTAMTENGAAGTFEVWNGVQGIQGIQGVQGFSISAVERVNATFNSGSSQSNEYRVILNDGNSTQVGTFTIVNGAQGQQGVQGEPGKTLTIRPSLEDCTVPDAHAFVYTGVTDAYYTHNHLYLLTAIDYEGGQPQRNFEDLGEFAIEGRGIASITTAATSDANRTGVDVTITLTDNTSSAFTVWNGTDAFTTNDKVKDGESNDKSYLLGHSSTNITDSAQTNSKVYMSGGTIYIDGNEVLTSGYTYARAEIDGMFSGITDSDEKVMTVTADTKVYLVGKAVSESTDTAVTNEKVFMSAGTIFIDGDEVATKSDIVVGVDEKVKTVTAETKAYLVAKTDAESTDTGITNTNVYMSAGTIFIGGNEVATKNDIVADTDSKVAYAADSTSTAYLLGTTVNGADTTSAVTSGVHMLNNGLYATNGFYQTSDEKLKDFGEDVKVDFDELAGIPKKYFTWKEKADSKQHIGTSAQELQKVYPELVKVDATGKLSVDYASLSVVALAAVDKLHKENEELKKRIESIERYLTERNK